MKPAPAPSSRRRPFVVTVKPVGERCNLACRYCHRPEDPGIASPAGGGPRMDDALLEKLVRDHLAAHAPSEPVRFVWQGGEPALLGLDAFRRVVEWQRRHGDDRPVENELQTNGTLLDDDWGRFLQAERFLVGLSIDGPRAMHDAFRLERDGSATWERAMSGLRVLRRHRVDFETLTVVHRHNCRHPRDVYDFLVSSGARRLRFTPLVERRPQGRAAYGPGLPAVPAAEAEFFVTQHSLPPGRHGQFLRTIFDHWVRRDVGRVVVQPFDSALAAWSGEEPSACAHTRLCRRDLTVDHDGETYGCARFSRSGASIGNARRTPLARIADGAASERFQAAKSSLPPRCLACPVRFACNGDCPAHRFVRSETGQPPLSYLCGDYRRFFLHVAPVMREMTALARAGRPLSEIMRRPVNRPPAGFE